MIQIIFTVYYITIIYILKAYRGLMTIFAFANESLSSMDLVSIVLHLETLRTTLYCLDAPPYGGRNAFKMTQDVRVSIQ